MVIIKLQKYITYQKFKNKNIKCRGDGDIPILQRIAKNLKRTKSDTVVCYGDEIIILIIKFFYNTIYLKTGYMTTIKITSNFGF